MLEVRLVSLLRLAGKKIKDIAERPSEGRVVHSSHGKSKMCVSFVNAISTVISQLHNYGLGVGNTSGISSKAIEILNSPVTSCDDTFKQMKKFLVIWRKARGIIIYVKLLILYKHSLHHPSL